MYSPKVRDTVTGLLYSTGNFTAAAQRFAADRLANVSAVIAKVDDELQREREAKSALVNKAKQSAEASSNHSFLFEPGGRGQVGDNPNFGRSVPGCIDAEICN